MNTSDTKAAEAYSQRGLDLLAAGSPEEAIDAFRLAMAADPTNIEASHGMIRAMRDAGRVEQAIAASLALIALTPGDPLAHTALSICLQAAGHIPEAEAAAARARVLEWKIQVQTVPGNAPGEGLGEDQDKNQGGGQDRYPGRDLVR